MKLYHINSFNELNDHLHDQYTGKGYNYEGNILKNVVSQEMFANPLNDRPLRQIERIVEFLINQVKRIKLQYAIAFDKNSKLIN